VLTPSSCGKRGLPVRENLSSLVFFPSCSQMVACHHLSGSMSSWAGYLTPPSFCRLSFPSLSRCYLGGRCLPVWSLPVSIGLSTSVDVSVVSPGLRSCLSCPLSLPPLPPPLSGMWWSCWRFGKVAWMYSHPCRALLGIRWLAYLQWILIFPAVLARRSRWLIQDTFHFNKTALTLVRREYYWVALSFENTTG
jgi:hypothetical protein